MASTYSDLKIELIGTGDQSGTWGATTNTNLGTALEEAIVGRATANFTSDANLTITLSNVNTTQVARNYILNVTSAVALTVTRSLIVPTIDKPYIIENNTTGGQSILVKTSAGTGITVPTGKTVMVYANGTNVVQAFDYVPSVTVGTVNITSLTAGSITDSGLTAGRVTYAGTAGLLADSASLTFDGTILSTTTVDATNLEVTNIKAKDGTAAGSIANSTGVVTIASSVLTTTDINGGTIDATAIGGSTPAAGAFTSGSFSTTLGVTGVATLTAQPILSSLTASSAVATDASKGLVSVTNTGTGNNVLATSPTITGATLTTAALNGTLGATTPSTVVATTVTDSGLTSGRITFASTGGLLADSATLTWSGSGLGVGIASAGYAIETLSSIKIGASSVNNVSIFNGLNSGTSGGASINVQNAGAGVISIGNYSNIIGGAYDATPTIYSNGALRTYIAGLGVATTIDSAGNVGIGVTPSAWGAASTAVQMGGGYSVSKFGYTQNAYYDGANYKAIATGLSTLYQPTGGQHIWYTAASAVAGATATFTQAMTLDASGNLGIGTSSPTAKLHIKQGSDGTPTQGFKQEAFVNDTVLAQYYHHVHGEWVISASYDTTGAFAPITWYTSDTKRMTLDAAGNLGLGVTPSAWGGASRSVIQLAGASAIQGSAAIGLSLYANSYFNGTNDIFTANGSAYKHEIGTGYIWKNATGGTAGGTVTWTSQMTLDASGNLGIGTNSPSDLGAGYQALTTNGTGGSGYFLNANAASIGLIFCDTGFLYAGTQGSFPFVFRTNATERMRLFASGGLSLGNTTDPGAGVLFVASGVRFPATQSASTDANTLDDYEEGTWTPTLSFGGASVGITYGANSGTYTKIGNLVTGRFVCVLSSKGSSTGFAEIQGLPFAVNADNLGSAVVELANNFVIAMVSSGYCENGTSAILLHTWTPTGMVIATDTNFANNTRLDMWFQYNV